MAKRRTKRRKRAPQLGLALPGWRVADFDTRTGNVTWSRPVWDGEVPIGQPGRSTRRGGAGRYIRPAIEEVDPYSAWGAIRALPGGLRRPGVSNFAFQVGFASREGEYFTVTGPAFYNVESITRPQILAQMLADVFVRAAGTHGYGGAVIARHVSLLMGADVSVVPARKGKRRPPPVARRKLPDKLRRLDPRSVRYGKRVLRRGKYYQPVYDQHGKRRALLPWYSGVRGDLRGLLELGRSLRGGEDEEMEGWEE